MAEMTEDEQLSMLMKAVRLRVEGRPVDAYYLLQTVLEAAPGNDAARKMRDEIYQQQRGVYTVYIYAGRNLRIPYKVPLNSKSIPSLFGGRSMPDWLPKMQAGVLAIGGAAWLAMRLFLRGAGATVYHSMAAQSDIVRYGVGSPLTVFALILGAAALLAVGVGLIVSAEMSRREAFQEMRRGENPQYENFHP
ncbi:hypothetical protein CCAX7_003900 [Capsulimonas corticalis]|uniref:Uncharacterized protein n=1 Tax=Capsulimonas corticalis TaxID=2219043 RepID=A0A402D307_9BACT|nr:hypothetical protein [Capsulimonas corticalis]BDI28339.1 hypothetical protein CCAX7_003900 [Capsulimonas corticalis]